MSEMNETTASDDVPEGFRRIAQDDGEHAYAFGHRNQLVVEFDDNDPDTAHERAISLTVGFSVVPGFVATPAQQMGLFNLAYTLNMILARGIVETLGADNITRLRSANQQGPLSAATVRAWDAKSNDAFGEDGRPEAS